MRGRVAIVLLAVTAVAGLAAGYLARRLHEPTGSTSVPTSPATTSAARAPGPALASGQITPRTDRTHQPLPRPPPARVPTLVGGLYTRAEVAVSSTASLTASRNAASTLERRALTRVAGSDDGTSLVDCPGSGALPSAAVVELHVVSGPSRIAVTDVRIVADGIPAEVAACISALAQGLEERADPAIPFLLGDAWLRRELVLPHGHN